jgi:DNA-binding response OmpR family regulator
MHSIWLLDGNTATGGTLSLLIGDWGYAPKWIADASALPALDLSEPPRALIVDDGFAASDCDWRQALDRLAKAWRTIPPIILLTSAFNRTVGAAVALEKPVDIERLRDTIDRLAAA